MSQQTITDAFRDFGYKPDPAEIDLFDQILRVGGKGSEGSARSSVGAYVEAQKQISERRKNDPLNPYVKQEADRAKQYESLSQDAYDKLTQLYQTAPKLFGSMTPDQMDQYLAPLQDQYSRALSSVEGAFNRRGLVGSNIEASSLGEQDRLFKQNVLATGLQVGQQQQQDLGNAYQNRSAALLQGAQGAYNNQGNALSQLSKLSADEYSMLASLPSYLQGQALQQLLIQKQLNYSPKKNIFGGALSGGLSGALTGFMLGGPAGAVAGGIGGGLIGGISANNSDGEYGQQNQSLLQNIPFYLMAAKGAAPGAAPGGAARPPSYGTSSSSYSGYPGTYTNTYGGGTSSLPPSLSLLR